jgi:hypothetical protein
MENKIEACVNDKLGKKPSREVEREILSQLKELFNRNGFEAYSNTPDYVLARVAFDAVVAFGEEAVERDKHNVSVSSVRVSMNPGTIIGGFGPGRNSGHRI